MLARSAVPRRCVVLLFARDRDTCAREETLVLITTNTIEQAQTWQRSVTMGHGASSTETRVCVRTTSHVTRATANPSCRCSSDPKTREPRSKAVPKGSWSPWRTARLRGARAQSHGERGPPAAWGPDRAACLHSRHCRRPRPPSPWLLSAAQTASVSFLPSRTLCFVKHDPIVWEPLVPLNRMTVTLFIGRLL